MLSSLKFVLFITIFISTVHARKWTVHTIPGAKCGAGAPYKIWIEQKSTKKLAIEFMGGGACWSASTCYGPTLRTWIFPIPSLPIMSMFSSKKSPAKDHSYLYLPYCTGDAHMGRHTAKYLRGKIKVHHQGFRNIEKTFEYLHKNNLIQFSEVEDLLVYGASAGAIGALVHSKTYSPYFLPNTKKTMIADAPGLHFSAEKFWSQFTPELIQDYSKGMTILGMDQSEGGYISRFIPKMCDQLKNWNIGILQGSKDVITSYLFGKISPKEHELLVYGKEGVWQMSQLTENCSAWVPSTYHHTFLIFPTSYNMEIDNKSAMGFATDIANGLKNQYYR